ncbi:MAG: ABC transporter substrate-binding protein [Chloroflexi bacterium]|nr:ABC transporter substrate-binding protein [Chloroflexota bacterium]
MKRLLSVLAVLVLIIILLSACARPAPSPTSPAAPTTPPPGTTAPVPKATPTPTAPAAGTPRYGGVLKTTHSSTLSSLISLNNVRHTWPNKALYDTFLRIDENGELQPNLISDWKLGTDMKSLTLTVRKGVKFHDGTDLNAASVKWNIEQRKAARLGDYMEVESVSVLDDYTVRLNFSKFENTLLIALWHFGGMPHSPTAYEKDGKDKAQWNPVGTGPFKLVSFTPDVSVKLERFDGYWQKGKPYLDKFEYHIIVDPTTRDLALQKGEVDASQSVTPETVIELEKKGWPVITGPMDAYEVLVMDTANADSPFGNKKVRAALEHAIDRPAVAKAVGLGRFQEALNQMAPAGNYAYNPNIKGLPYDPKKARQLMAEAGYPNGFKTWIMRPFRNTDSTVAVASYLKEIGIEAEIRIVNPGILYGFLRENGWKTGLFPRSYRMEPDWLAFLNSVVSTKVQENVSVLRPPGFQGLLDQALAATDAASKSKASQQVVKMMSDELMHIPLWGSLPVIMHRDGVHNLEYFMPWGPNKLWSPADVWMSK